MGFLAVLWLPIVVSAVFVFVASSVLHMVLPLHKGDYRRLPGEDELRKAFRAHGVKPGEYSIPCPTSMKELNSPEMLARFEEGPVAFVTVLPNGPMPIGKSLAQWFVYSLVIGVFVAYLGSITLAPGAHYLQVFRITGTVAVLGYSLAYVPDSIWKGLSWTITAKFMFDGLIYGLLTAGTFGWLWPSA